MFIGMCVGRPCAGSRQAAASEAAEWVVVVVLVLNGGKEMIDEDLMDR